MRNDSDLLLDLKSFQRDLNPEHAITYDALTNFEKTYIEQRFINAKETLLK